MDDLTAVLLNRLIEKTFAGMEQEEKLAFVEKLFAEMKPHSQERFLLQLARGVGGDESNGRSPFIRLEICDDDLQDIGPWRMCCRMMADIDRADTLTTLETGEPARLFHALADETRIKIIKLLSEGERRVDDLTQALDSGQSTVSHHLRILKEAGFIRGNKRGRSVYYELTHPMEIVTHKMTMEDDK